jgi:hypothetical protein
VTAARLAGERWKPIPAYRLLGIPAGYEASGEGRVRSPRQVLTQRPDGDGYPTVKLGGRPRRVAILVQLAWAGAPEVLHLDDDRENSRPSNLRWGSRVENEQMKRKKGKEIRDGMECVPPFPPRTPGTAEQR